MTTNQRQSPNETPGASKNELLSKNQELAAANKQLREKVKRLEASAQRFRVLVENVPALFSYVDTEQRYVFVNKGYEKLFHKSSDEIVGSTMREILGADTYEVAQPHIAEAVSGREVSYEIEMKLHGASRWMRVKFVPDFDGSGRVKGFFVLVTERTREKEALQSLQTSRDRLASVLDTVAEAIVTIDKTGTIDSFNAAAERMFGYATAEVMGRNVKMLMPEPYGSDGDIERYLRNGEAQLIGIGREAMGQRKDGSTFPIDLSVSEIGSRERFTGIIRDITERKKAEEALELSREELRLLSARLITAEESERQRLSRELHDDFNQRLAMLAIDLEKLSYPERLDASTESKLAELHEQVTALSDDVHAMAYRLHPSILDDLGLSAAVRSLMNDFSTRYSIAVSFRERNCPDRITPALSSCLYRVVQESLTNIAKHSESPRVTIRLAGTEEALRLSLRDYGVGFDVQAARNHRKSLGIVSMEERVRMVGGELVIWSFPRKGTRIRVTVPLE